MRSYCLLEWIFAHVHPIWKQRTEWVASCFCTTKKQWCKSDACSMAFKSFDQHKFIYLFYSLLLPPFCPHKTVQQPSGKTSTLRHLPQIPNSDSCACMLTARLSSTNVKYVADSLQKLPHPPPASISSHCSCVKEHTERQKVAGSGVLGKRGRGWRGVGVAPWERTLASAACLLSCLIHSLYHLIRPMWRCGEEALLHWDRVGGATLHLLLPRRGNRLGWIATCMGKKCGGEWWEGRGAMWMHRGSWRAAHVAAHERSAGAKGRTLGGGTAGAVCRKLPPARLLHCEVCVQHLGH